MNFVVSAGMQKSGSTLLHEYCKALLRHQHGDAAQRGVGTGRGPGDGSGPLDVGRSGESGRPLGGSARQASSVSHATEMMCSTVRNSGSPVTSVASSSWASAAASGDF